MQRIHAPLFFILFEFILTRKKLMKPRYFLLKINKNNFHCVQQAKMIVKTGSAYIYIQRIRTKLPDR